MKYLKHDLILALQNFLFSHERPSATEKIYSVEKLDKELNITSTKEDKTFLTSYIPPRGYFN